MTEQLLRSREWLLLNAVEAWLHHYGNVDTPTLAQYKELQVEFHDAYMLTLNKDADDDTPTVKSPRKRTTNGSHSQPS